MRVRCESFRLRNKCDGYATPQDKAAAFRDLRIDDGGTYDTLGLESVWKTHATILCSDGGGAFLITPDRGWLDRIKRYLIIQFNQSVNVRKRWLIDSFVRGEYDGAYWGAASAPIRYGITQGYSKELARTVISQVRTDLDHFTEAEQAVLENHGYFLAGAALKTHAPQLITNPNAPLEVPNPDWMDEKKPAGSSLSNDHARYSNFRVWDACSLDVESSGARGGPGKGSGGQV